MTAADIIRHHEDLAKCPAWVTWLQPYVRDQIDTKTRTALRAGTPEEREAARLAANTLQDLLDYITTTFQSSLRDLQGKGQLPPYMAHLLTPSANSPQPGHADHPGHVAVTEFDMETLGAQLMAKVTASIAPTSPPQIPPELHSLIPSTTPPP